MTVNLLPSGPLAAVLLIVFGLALAAAVAVVLSARRRAQRARPPKRRTQRTHQPAPRAVAATAPQRPRAAPGPAPASAPTPRPEPPPFAPPVAPTAPTATMPVRLLLVDDSAVVRAKLRKLFEGAGYVVVLARDGVEALEALPTAFFSVLVTDLEMPNMSGAELIASVQRDAQAHDLPIIAISGNDELQAHVREGPGVAGFFKKPWNDAELLERVAVLAKRRNPPVARMLAAAARQPRGREAIAGS